MNSIRPFHRVLILSVAFALPLASQPIEPPTPAPKPVPKTAYDYRIEVIPVPALYKNGKPVAQPQLPANCANFEIVDVIRAEAIVEQPANNPSPPEKRDVLIYTLRKLK